MLMTCVRNGGNFAQKETMRMGKSTKNALAIRTHTPPPLALNFISRFIILFFGNTKRNFNNKSTIIDAN